MIWWAAIIELIPGALVLVGLFTRPAAFIAAGEMAFAYWIGHFPREPLPEGFFPVNNDGDAAILFCFIFLYLVFAGPGRWSIDATAAAESGAGRLDFGAISCYIIWHRRGCPVHPHPLISEHKPPHMDS